MTTTSLRSLLNDPNAGVQVLALTGALEVIRQTTPTAEAMLGDESLLPFSVEDLAPLKGFMQLALAGIEGLEEFAATSEPSSALPAPDESSSAPSEAPSTDPHPETQPEPAQCSDSDAQGSPD